MHEEAESYLLTQNPYRNMETRENKAQAITIICSSWRWMRIYAGRKKKLETTVIMGLSCSIFIIAVNNESKMGRRTKNEGEWVWGVGEVLATMIIVAEGFPACSRTYRIYRIYDMYIVVLSSFACIHTISSSSLLLRTFPFHYYYHSGFILFPRAKGPSWGRSPRSSYFPPKYDMLPMACSSFGEALAYCSRRIKCPIGCKAIQQSPVQLNIPL